MKIIDKSLINFESDFANVPSTRYIPSDRFYWIREFLSGTKGSVGNDIFRIIFREKFKVDSCKKYKNADDVVYFDTNGILTKKTWEVKLSTIVLNTIMASHVHLTFDFDFLFIIAIFADTVEMWNIPQKQLHLWWEDRKRYKFISCESPGREKTKSFKIHFPFTNPPNEIDRYRFDVENPVYFPTLEQYSPSNALADYEL